MIAFHAVLIDETQCEFGVYFNAKSRNAAHDYLRESYPESHCVQLEADNNPLGHHPPDDEPPEDTPSIDLMAYHGPWHG